MFRKLIKLRSIKFSLNDHESNIKLFSFVSIRSNMTELVSHMTLSNNLKTSLVITNVILRYQSKPMQKAICNANYSTKGSNYFRQQHN